MTKEQIEAMEEYYSLKSLTLTWYRYATSADSLEKSLYCLLMWQLLADESMECWGKVGENNQVRLTVLAGGYAI